MKPNWIGRQFETKMDDGQKCVALMGTKSLVYTPVTVTPNTTYELEFLAKKESGNGTFFTNLYGSAKFDFPQQRVLCTDKWETYKIKLQTKNFPATQPISFRMWKNEKSTGITLIKSIRVSFLKAEIIPRDILPKPPAPVRPPSYISNKRNSPPVRQKNTGTKNLEMANRYQRKLAQQQKVSPQARVVTPLRTIVKPDFNLTKFKPMPYVTHFPNNLHNTKVLYLPANNEQIKQTGVEDAFVNAGFQLCSFDFRNCFNYTSGQNCLATFKKTIRDYKPDWIHMQLQYTGFIPARTLEEVKVQNPNTMITNWSGDVRDFANLYYVQCGNAIDLSLLCNVGQLPMFRNKGLKNIEYWQIGIDPKQTYRLPDAARDKLKAAYNHDIVFCASFTSKFPDSNLRLKYVNALAAKYGTRFAVYGTNWENKSFRGYLPYYDQNDVYNASKIAISINHFNNIKKYFSDRQLLTMGSGTLTLCHYIPGLEEYFENGKDCVWFKTVPECLEKVDYYLSHPKEAEEIGKRGAEKIAKKHSYLSRVNNLAGRLKISPTPPDPPRDISMVLGTHNRIDLLKRIIPAAMKSAEGCDYEIVINDASSTDGTIKWLKKLSAKNDRIVPIFGKKEGITKAYNQCFQKARGKFLIWLSDDTLPLGKAIFNMFNIMKTKPENCQGAFETRNDSSLPFMIPRVGALYMPIVACVHKSYMEKIGFWNMDYPYYGQDSEWNARVYRTGGRIIPTQEQIDHLNCQDDLKSDNLESYKKDGFFEKYRLFYALRFGRKSPHKYPIILLNIAKGTEYENVKEVLTNFRALYKNINFALLWPYGKKLQKEFPSIHIIKDISKTVWPHYDLIINMNNNVRKVLLWNGTEKTGPFIRRLMYG